MILNFLCIVLVCNSYHYNLWWHDKPGLLWSKYRSLVSFLFSIFFTVYFAGFHDYVHLFLFYCWACKSILRRMFFDELQKIFIYFCFDWVAVRCWTIKCFFGISFSWFDFDTLDHHKLVFVCILDSVVVVHSVVQFLRKFPLIVIEMIIAFLLILEVVF